jgi:2-methylcitrate dehydratase
MSITDQDETLTSRFSQLVRKCCGIALARIVASNSDGAQVEVLQILWPRLAIRYLPKKRAHTHDRVEFHFSSTAKLVSQAPDLAGKKGSSRVYNKAYSRLIAVPNLHRLGCLMPYLRRELQRGLPVKSGSAAGTTPPKILWLRLRNRFARSYGSNPSYSEAGKRGILESHEKEKPATAPVGASIQGGVVSKTVDQTGADASAPIRELAQWTLEANSVWTDPLVIYQTKLLILDSIGCAVAALDVQTPRRVATMLDELGGNPKCSIIGQREKTSILSAVLMNGALVRSLDFNDVQFFMKEGKLSVAGHCSDNIPAALASAEYLGASGLQTIETIAMGYELFGRLRNLMPFSSAWDGTSVSGLVAAAMFGRLAGFDQEKQANALALAAIRCATPSVVRWGKLSGAKNIANAFIAQSGVQAALLAGLGVTGPLEVLDHRGGLHQVYDPELGFENLWAPVTLPHFVMTSCIKPYACIGTAQTTIAAALALYPKVKNRIDRIARIQIIMADLPMIRKQQGEIYRQFPKTREAADHSFTFLPAVAMAEGAMTDEQFRDHRWEHPDMKRLIDVTELSVDPDLATRAPGSMPSRIILTFDDGSQIEQECLFHPGHSFPDKGLDQKVVFKKFEGIARSRLDTEHIERISEAVTTFDSTNSDVLMQPLREIG